MRSPLNGRIAAVRGEEEAFALRRVAGIVDSELSHEIAVGLRNAARIAGRSEAVGRVVETGKGAKRIAVADRGSRSGIEISRGRRAFDLARQCGCRGDHQD